MLSVDQEAAVRATGLALTDLVAADGDLLKELFQEVGLTAKQKILVHSAIKTFLGNANKIASEALSKQTSSEASAAALSPLRLLPLLASRSSEPSPTVLSLEKPVLRAPVLSPAPPPLPSKPSSLPKPPPPQEQPQSLGTPASELFASNNGNVGGELRPLQATSHTFSQDTQRTELVKLEQKEDSETILNQSRKQAATLKTSEEKSWRDAHGILPSISDIGEQTSPLRKSPKRKSESSERLDENPARLADETGAHFPADEKGQKTFHSNNPVIKSSPTGHNLLAKVDNVYVCDLCMVKCVSAGAATTHTNTKRHLTNSAIANAQVTEDGKNLWQCSLCPSRSETSDELRSHLHSQHRETFGDGVSHKRKPRESQTFTQRETRRSSKISVSTDNPRRSSREWQPSVLSLQIIANETTQQQSTKQASPVKQLSPSSSSTTENRGRVTRATNRSEKRKAASANSKGKGAMNENPRSLSRSMSMRSQAVFCEPGSGNMTELIRDLENHIQQENDETC